MLYITGTPIGNLDDMSYRAIKTLKEADVILCEDTRITRKLTTHFEIDTPLKSYHDFNKEEVTESIIEDIQNGKTYALVTDAGMPVSDQMRHHVVACLAVINAHARQPVAEMAGCDGDDGNAGGHEGVDDVL